MIRETLSVMRDFDRLRAIAGILMRYGWGDIAKKMGKGSVIGWTGRALNFKASHEILQLPAEVRVRLAIEELGPTFVKLGQVLATRPDIFLQTGLPNFPSCRIRFRRYRLKSCCLNWKRRWDVHLLIFS